MTQTRRINLLFIALLAATALTWALGEAGLTTSGAALGPAIVVLALSLGKGLGIALEFMELRTAPALWRRLVAGWLVVVLAVILGLRWIFG